MFLPFRNEMQDIHLRDVEELYRENEDSIEFVRNKFEKYREIVNIIRNIEEKNAKQKDEGIDDDDDIDSELNEEETTTAEEMKDFMDSVEKLKNSASTQAKKQLKNFNDGRIHMDQEDYLSSVDSLNVQQRKIFDDFVERISDPNDTAPFYLYIGGEAGTGKSFLLKTMIEAVNKLPKYSGQELDKPYYLTVAPTGVAAYIVNGSTIESALGIQPQRRKTYKGNNASKNSDLRFLYGDLKVLFLDEVSMVGTDKLTTVNLRMQEIMGNNEFMGGVSIVCTGDFGQLPPVKEKMIWTKSYLDGRPDLSPEYWNEYFKIYYLTEKMRSKDDDFSNISDKVRKGICDSDVLRYMKSHVRKCPNKYNSKKYADGKLSIIV